VLRGTRNSGTSITGAKENKLRRDKRWNPAISAGVCITVRVNTVCKDAIGVVQSTTRLQTVLRRHGINKATYKEQA